MDWEMLEVGAGIGFGCAIVIIEVSIPVLIIAALIKFLFF